MRFSQDWSKDSVALIAAAVLVLSSATAAVAQAVGSDTQSVVADTEITNNSIQPADFVFANLRAIEAKEMAQIQARTKSVSALAAEVKISKSSAAAKLDSYENRRKPLEPEELKELLKLVGFEGEALKLAWGIVMRESRGGPTAHNGNSNTGDNSYGLFQINMIGGLGADRREKFGLKTNDELFDPVTNAKIAFHMSGGGKDFGAWGVGPNAYNGGKVGDLYTWVAKFPN
jgi:hypothetical protein